MQSRVRARRTGGLFVALVVACGDGASPTADADGATGLGVRVDGGADAAGQVARDGGRLEPDGGVPRADGSAVGRDAAAADRTLPDAGPALTSGPRLKAAWPQRSARFGAALAMDEALVVGAPAASGCGVGVSPAPEEGCTFSGEAYVFATDGALEARLKASTTGERDAFGAAVATSRRWAFVGAPREDGCPGAPEANACTDAGAVHAYLESDRGWAHAARLGPAGEASGVRFGSALAVAAERLVVGAPEQRRCGPEECVEVGAAHVFELRAGAWVQTATLTDAAPIEGARFGAAVALGVDDMGRPIIVVGAPDDPRCNATDRAGGCPQAGSAHVFVQTSTSWTHAAALRAEAPAAFDLFGFAVAADAAVVAVGVRNDPRCGSGVDPSSSDRTCSTSGAVEIFELGAEGWPRAAVLKGAASGRGDRFGSALAFGAGSLFVGAPGEASCGSDADPQPEDDACANAGAVTRFERRSSGWLLAEIRKPTFTRAQLQFGAAVSVSSGGALAVGVPGGGSCRADAPEAVDCFESGRVELVLTQ